MLKVNLHIHRVVPNFGDSYLSSQKLGPIYLEVTSGAPPCHCEE